MSHSTFSCIAFFIVVIYWTFLVIKQKARALSHCNCGGTCPCSGCRTGWIERLLMTYVPHFDIVKKVEGTTTVYLRRFYIWRSKWINKNWGDIYLHHIRRQDDDRDPHDHPWAFTGLVLKGGYTDESWKWSDGQRTGPNFEQVKPCRIIKRAAEHIHRVRMTPEQQAAGGAWTLIFTTGRTREWNFITESGPVVWRKYLGVADGVDVGE